MFFAGLFCIGLSFVIICVICFKLNDDCQKAAGFGFAFAFCVFLAIFLTCEGIKPSITPIDVYRGKTTLEITYRDGVSVDSVVVWRRNNHARDKK